MSNDSDVVYPHFSGSASGDENLGLKRQMAEARMKLKTAHLTEHPETLTPEAIRHLLHELGVHQIELEMQNEELRESQIALDAARGRYFDLYDLAPVGYFAISEHGLICQVNLSAANVLGLVRSALHKQPLSKLILPQDQDIYYLHRKRLMEGGELQSFELRMLKADSSIFWAHLTMTAAHDAEGEIELRVVLNDITERKQLQQALVAKNAELEKAVVFADKANQAKSDFLSSMSHELRTPLNAILGFGQLLATSTLDNEMQLSAAQKQSVDQILKAGWHLLELIDEVLDLAVIEAGRIGLSIESVSLPELIGECEDMVRPMAQLHGIEMQYPSALGLSCFVQADRIRLKQVLINLFSNAIKYNRRGGSVSVSWRAIPGGRTRISVADTGAGLSPEKLSQLFQPFNRLGQEFSGKEGTGIGLVVCKKLTGLMKGNIGAESAEGKGSVFWIELIQTNSTSGL